MALQQAPRIGFTGSSPLADRRCILIEEILLMPSVPLYPLRFDPILRRLIWGGRRLGTVLHKPIGDGNDYAESWELSDYRDAVSVVNEGKLAGTTLRDLVHQRGREVLGPGTLATAASSRSWSSSSTPARSSRSRFIPTMKKANAWPETMARPRPGWSSTPSRAA